jgi:hypothetical protein
MQVSQFPPGNSPSVSSQGNRLAPNVKIAGEITITVAGFQIGMRLCPTGLTYRVFRVMVWQNVIPPEPGQEGGTTP